MTITGLGDIASLDVTDNHAYLDAGTPAQKIEGFFLKKGEKPLPVVENVAREVPVSLLINGETYYQTTCSPCQLRELAVGSAHNQGFISEISQVTNIRVYKDNGVLAVDLGVDKDKRTQRVFDEKDTLSEIQQDAIFNAESQLEAAQKMRVGNGATHGAAFCDAQGNYQFLCEDISRHCAVNKLIGMMIMEGVNPASGFIFLSSRCAQELVAMCAKLGVNIICSVSAPTSYVMEYAQENGLTIVAYARGEHATVYTHIERIAGIAE